MTSTIGVTEVIEGQPVSTPASDGSENESPSTLGIVSPVPAGYKRHATLDYDPSINAKPYSPFYRHATPNLSAHAVELQRLRRGTNDIEAGNGNPHLHGGSHEPQRPRQSKLWEKRQRCVWWRQLSRGSRFALEVVIAVVIVGGMIGIALGFTAAGGGGIWRSM